MDGSKATTEILLNKFVGAIFEKVPISGQSGGIYTKHYFLLSTLRRRFFVFGLIGRVPFKILFTNRTI